MKDGGLTALARRAAGSLALRGVVTAGLLAFVFARLDWSAIRENLRDGDLRYGLLAVLCVASGLAVAGLRWKTLLQASGIPLSTRELYRIYAVTSFANAFLPTSVGGDVARPLMVSRRGPLLVRAATTVVLERLCAFLALLALAWIGVALVPEAVSSGALLALGLVSVAFLVVVGLALGGPAPLRRLARQAIPARFATHLAEVGIVLRGLRSGRVLLLILVLSLVSQALITIQLVLLAKMIGVALSSGLAAVALALVTLAQLAPISIGGFGVREGSYVAVLAGGGIGHTDAVLISLLSVVALFLATLPGALELVRSGFSVAAMEPES